MTTTTGQPETHVFQLGEGSWLEWTGCTCGAPVTCPPWIGAANHDNAPSCGPYPCVCKPKYAGQCRWNGCGCHGRTPLPDAPAYCCRPDTHPLYLAPAPQPLVVDPEDPDAPSGAQEAVQGAEERYAADVLAVVLDGDDPERPSHQRLWPAEATLCDCATPWDTPKANDKAKPVHQRKRQNTSGYHCSQCHQNFKNAQLAEMHLKRWGVDGECRWPGEICDVDTGRPLLRETEEGGYTVWSATYDTACTCGEPGGCPRVHNAVMVPRSEREAMWPHSRFCGAR